MENTFFTDTESRELTVTEVTDRLGGAAVRKIADRRDDPNDGFVDTQEIEVDVINQAREITGELELSDIAAKIAEKEE